MGRSETGTDSDTARPEAGSAAQLTRIVLLLQGIRQVDTRDQ